MTMEDTIKESKMRAPTIEGFAQAIYESETSRHPSIGRGTRFPSFADIPGEVRSNYIRRAEVIWGMSEEDVYHFLAELRQGVDLNETFHSQSARLRQAADLIAVLMEK